MKKIIFAIITLLFITLTTLAQATQPCIVRQYNQEREKTALPGVQVTVSNAGSQTSDAKGRLTLTFRTLKPGDRVNLISAKLAGYEVFNKSVVEQWNISRDNTPFSLVMVRSDYMAERKARLNQASTDSYKEKYEQAVKELEQLKQKGKLKEEEFNQKMDEAERNYQLQLSNLDNYIDQFAQIDLNEVKEEELHILEMVEQGKIDEAVKAWEKLDISGKLQQEWEDIKVLEEKEKKIKKEKAKKVKNFESLQVSQEHEIATLKLAGGKANLDKVAQMLKNNALRDTTNIDVVGKYAEFAYRQRDFKEAERFYLICLNGCGDDPFEQSAILNNLGNMYSKSHNYTKAEEYYLKSLECKNQLFAQDPEAHRAELAGALNNLALLYADRHNYAKAEEFFLEELDNVQQLFAQDPDTYRPALAGTQLNLGLLYANLRNYTKAEEYYLQALDNRTLLFEQDPETHRVGLASVQNNLGILYYHLRNYTKAEEYYLKALDNKTILYEKNPDAGLADLAITQLNLGNLYAFQGNHAKAEEFLLKTLDSNTLLFNKNPEAYRSSLSMTQNNLGSLYKDIHDYTKSEEYYLKALENKTILFERAPDVFRADFAMIQNNLGNLYNDLHDYAKAEKYYLTALEKRAELYQKNPRLNQRNYINALNRMAYFYANQKDFTKAIENIDQAISLQPDDANLYDTKGEILLMKGDEKGAMEMWRKILEADPDFVQKTGQDSELYKQLKERGKVKSEN